MKTQQLMFILLFLLAAGCSPRNDEATEEHIDTDPSETTIDSLSDTRRDRVARPETETFDPKPLPQPVMQLLEQHYETWQQPVLVQSAEERASDHDQGPCTVRGDFNGDGQQDFAVQVQQGNQVIVLVFLQRDGDWQMHEIMKDILFNERGNLKSMYYLFLTEAGSELQDPQQNRRFDLESDAISVGIESNVTTYVLENGRFRGYTN